MNTNIKNNIEKITFIPSYGLKQMFNNLRKSKNICENDLQLFSDGLCFCVGVKPIEIKFKGVQRINIKEGVLNVTVGVYHYNKKRIIIYKKVAGGKGNISSKAALNYLLHELCHYFDYSLLKLKETKHNVYFFKRIRNIKNMLLW